MPYKCLTYLMVGDEKKNPGDTVTKAELEAAGQTDENVQQLLDGGAISEDMDADLDPNHQTPEAPDVGDSDNHVHAEDGGSGE